MKVKKVKTRLVLSILIQLSVKSNRFTFFLLFLCLLKQFKCNLTVKAQQSKKPKKGNKNWWSEKKRKERQKRERERDRKRERERMSKTKTKVCVGI